MSCCMEVCWLFICMYDLEYLKTFMEKRGFACALQVGYDAENCDAF